MSTAIHTSTHAVMMRVNDYGVLITGAAAIGKSSFALALLERGHQLIADDLVLLEQKDHQLIASCPAELKGLLHSRELGLIDIAYVFGKKAIHDQQPVNVIVHLATDNQNIQLEPQLTETQLHGIVLPILTLFPQSACPLAIRLEIWLKNWAVQDKMLSYFKQKQQKMMQQ